MLETITDFGGNYFYLRPIWSYKGADDLGDSESEGNRGNTFFSLPLWSVHAYGLNDGSFKDNNY